MAEAEDTGLVTIRELIVSTLAQGDALAKLLIEKGLITREEYIEKLSAERSAYQKLLSSTVQ
jgi:type IV secretory pathway component VirB8